MSSAPSLPFSHAPASSVLFRFPDGTTSTYGDTATAASQLASALRELGVREGDRIAVIAEARSFLHHQVRSMVGCLVLVGHGKWRAEDMAVALAARDRAALGHNAPPDGLYFTGARYS